MFACLRRQEAARAADAHRSGDADLADAVGILRTKGPDSPILSYTKNLAPALCSYSLIESIKVAYQVDVGAPNYQVFSGNVRREDVEKCLVTAKDC